jgi:predicted Fe-S protein YdhL (DUF1289 family)
MTFTDVANQLKRGVLMYSASTEARGQDIAAASATAGRTANGKNDKNKKKREANNAPVLDDFVSTEQWRAMSSREKCALLKACSKQQKQKGNRQVSAATTTAPALTEQNLVCIVDLLQQCGIGAAQTNNTLTDSAGDAFGGRAQAACDKKHGA